MTVSDRKSDEVRGSSALSRLREGLCLEEVDDDHVSVESLPTLVSEVSVSGEHAESISHERYLQLSPSSEYETQSSSQHHLESPGYSKETDRDTHQTSKHSAVFITVIGYYHSSSNILVIFVINHYNIGSELIVSPTQ